MPLVNALDLLEHARRHGYGLGRFTPRNLESLAGIVDAAERRRAPLLLSLEPQADDAVALDLLMPAVVAAARRTGVPVAIRVGACGSADAVAQAIRLGANLVGLAAIDGTAETSAASAHSLSELAHTCGVGVEGRYGRGVPVEEAERCRVRMQADTVAVTQWEPEAADRAARLMTAPLSLADASALDTPRCHALIARGVAGFGFPALCDEALPEALGETGSSDAGEIARRVRETVGARAEACLERVQAAGRAAEALAACRPWREVEHLIVYNVNEDMDEAAVQAMMARGREELGAIPGVRRVFTGRTVRADAAYRYCWLVRFSAEAVIPAYRDHPDHVRFADELFRPVAGNRISIDYEEID